MSAANYQRASQKAQALLDQFEITEPIVNVFEIAQRSGYNVHFFRSEGKFTNVSGFYDPSSKSIFVNGEDPSTRQAFTVAHELGHALLDHPETEYDVLWRLASPIDKVPVEQEANWFAANLLVPEPLLQKIMKEYNLTHDDITLLSKMFGVSKDVIKYRILWMQKKN